MRLRRTGVALDDERTRGTLVPGRLADLVVLDRDPFACEPEELPQVEVVATMVAAAGCTTHRRGESPGPSKPCVNAG